MKGAAAQRGGDRTKGRDQTSRKPATSGAAGAKLAAAKEDTKTGGRSVAAYDLSDAISTVEARTTRARSR
jgi:hypothetical protein